MSKRTNRVNYRSANTPATVKKQERIRELLSLAGEGFTITEIGRALGISRQLALYHVKKMAAQAQLVMILEPCIGNGGVQFRVWDEGAIMAHYSRMMLQTMVPAAQVSRAA
jgi:DNA-binding CsgD family transcriptional regulator